jgi:hypothetical protein
MESLQCDSEFLDESVINPTYILSAINQAPTIKFITFEQSCSPLQHTSLLSAALLAYIILFTQMSVSITFANKHSGLTETGWKIKRKGEAPITVVSTSICGLSAISQLLRS